MELKEPKRKKKSAFDPKSSLPLVFGSKGELTIFHASLTALGSCVADPTEMEIIHKMGYFGKGSLSRSQPSFGRIRHNAPPIIRKRQWQRRQEWISEVQKLSSESFLDDGKNDQTKNDKTNNEEIADENEKIGDKGDHLKNSEDNLSRSQELDVLTLTGSPTIKDKSTSDIEILEHDSIHNNIQTNGQNNQINMEVDEVILDSTEEEDICELSTDNFQQNSFQRNDSFDEEIQIVSEYNKDISDLQGKVLVLPDSDSDTENYLINIKPEIKHENFPVRETLHLTFEETFFLMYGLGCLRVIDFDGKYLSIAETWNYFCKEQSAFLQKYVTYHYFRSKGWVVKPGLKYGGDFLLYKEGPPHYHASYIVIIDVLDAVTIKRIENKVVRNMIWNKLYGLQRLAETVGKEILFAQVLWPSSVPTDIIPTSPDVLSQFTVREVLWRRWKLNYDTSGNNIEDDNGDDEDEDDYYSS